MTLTLGVLIIIDQQKLQINHPNKSFGFRQTNKIALRIGVDHQMTCLMDMHAD